MRFTISTAATLIVLVMANFAQAQFDLGRIVKGEAQQMMRNLENNVREQIRNEFHPPRYETLPYPPITNQPPIQYHPPVCNQPPVIIGTPVVQPSPKPEPKLPQVELGTAVSIDGKGFGKEPGTVYIKIDSMVLTAELIEWDDDLANAKLPRLPLADNVKATIFVMTAKEEVVEKLDIILTPPTSNEEDSAEVETGNEEEPQLPVVHSGQAITLEGELGQAKGRVVLQIGSLKFDAKITEWKASETTLQLPEMETAEPHLAILIVHNADGEIVEQIEVQYSGKPE